MALTTNIIIEFEEEAGLADAQDVLDFIKHSRLVKGIDILLSEESPINPSKSRIENNEIDIERLKRQVDGLIIRLDIQMNMIQNLTKTIG